jgi:hypothetical protein
MEVLDVSERESFYWILLAQGKIQWRAPVNTVMPKVRGLLTN